MAADPSTSLRVCARIRFGDVGLVVSGDRVLRLRLKMAAAANLADSRVSVRPERGSVYSPTERLLGPARTRVPSCATRLKLSKRLCMSTAGTWVKRASGAPACALRKSLIMR